MSLGPQTRGLAGEEGRISKPQSSGVQEGPEPGIQGQRRVRNQILRLHPRSSGGGPPNLCLRRSSGAAGDAAAWDPSSDGCGKGKGQLVRRYKGRVNGSPYGWKT